MKETFSFVPQELAKHFIEPTYGKKKICLKYIEEEEEDIEQDISLSKWSIVRNLFSKVQTSVPQQQQFLSKYGVLQNKCIGEGVSATVQLLKQGQERLAVKIFKRRKTRENSSGYMKALTSEFCISSSLNHSNIIKTLGFVKMDQDHSKYCIVMEYCPDGDMYGLIKQGLMQDKDIDMYFKQLLLGIEYLHKMGVAHRDLKPENLLLSNGVLKISDFGSADVFKVAWQNQCKLSKGLCGTTPYMAPEIFSNQDGYCAAPVDIWAAGIIYFCMQFDGVPFGSALRTDINYPIYLQKRNLQHYGPFNTLKIESSKILYDMLNPNYQTRQTIHDLLKLPWLQNI